MLRDTKEDALAQALGWFSLGLGLTEVLATGSLTRYFGMEKSAGLVCFFGIREITAGAGLLTRPQPAPWFWARVGGDMMDLAALASALNADNPKRGRVGVALAVVAAITMVDIASAQMSSRKQAEDGEPEVGRAITIGRPADELFQFWSDPQNLSQIMAHFAEVTATDAGRTHWRARTPVGRDFVWDTQVVESRPGEALRWQTGDGAPLPHQATLGFRPAPGGRGTEVSLRFHFDPPGGAAGVTAAKLLGFVPGLLAERALRRFKSLVETGEVPTLEANPSGRGSGDTY